jgi:hypothetical protein
MSAAATARALAIPDPFGTGIKHHFVKVRQSDMAMFSSLKTPTEAYFISYILVNSVGWGKPWTPATSMSQLAKHCCNVDERTVQNAMAATADLYDRRRSSTGKGFEYRLKRPIDYDGKEALGHCPDCKKTVQFTLDRWVPIPHSFFLKLHHAVDFGTWRCILGICIDTFQWQVDQIWIHPAAIKSEDFQRRTRLHRAELFEDLRKARDRGFIGAAGQPGAVQTWWPIPAAWEFPGLRLVKKGGNPNPRKRNESEPKVTEPVQPEQTTPQTSPVEFWSRPCGHCHECPYWGPVDLVESTGTAPKKPVERARAGPIGQSGGRKTKWDETRQAIWEMFVAK